MKFTIYTACYNSAPFIQRVFDSITSQTYTNLEWIIIDDCSTDDTVSLVNSFIKAHPDIDIKFLQNETNRGLSYGRSRAIKMATGDFFVSWDHDDAAKPFQLERLQQVWKDYGTSSIGNIWSLCEDENGRVVGNEFPGNISVANYFDYYVDYIMDGRKPKIFKERFVCSRVEALRYVQNRYENEKIMPEGYFPNGEDIWGMMALKYNTIFLNEVLRVYYIEPERPSMSKTTREKIADRTFLKKTIWLNYYMPKIPFSQFGLTFRLYFSYAFYGYLSKRNARNILSALRSVKNKIIVACFLPVAFIIYTVRNKS